MTNTIRSPLAVAQGCHSGPCGCDSDPWQSLWPVVVAPWLWPVAVARGPWLWPMAVARGCGPWLCPVAMARGCPCGLWRCDLWLCGSVARGCGPWRGHVAMARGSLWRVAVAVARSCGLWLSLWPVAVTCGPWLWPVAVTTTCGCVAVARGCSPGLWACLSVSS